MLPANFNSQATGVNNAGTVVGFYQDDTAGDFSAFVDVAGAITSFEFPGSTSTQALGVNDKGEIVGDYVLNGGRSASSTTAARSARSTRRAPCLRPPMGSTTAARSLASTPTPTTA